MGPSRNDLVRDACKFNAGVWQLGLEEQAAFIRNCIEVLSHAYRQESGERLVLVRWIEAE
jgi:hypothetical protein